MKENTDSKEEKHPDDIEHTAIAASNTSGISPSSSRNQNQLESPCLDDLACSSSPVESQTSHTSSSKRSDRLRVVELLQTNEENNDSSHHDDNWMIGEDFYQEDVAAEDETSDISGLGDNYDDEEYNAHRVVEPDDADSTGEEDDDEADMGFELAPNEDDHLGGVSSEEEDEDVNRNAIDYDISIPIEHRYLGENLEESRGRKILVDNSIITLPLFDIRHIVLLPGQMLPITTDNLGQTIHMYLRRCLTRGECLIGLVSCPRHNPYGTTAEIRNYGTSDGEEQIRIIMEGRQRFRLLSQPFETAKEGLVMILPEVSLGRPYPELRSWKRLYPRTSSQSIYIVSRHPKWLLRNHEAHHITKRIVDQIKDWCSNAPSKNPNDFSYWVASNLPINNSDRMKVLRFDCTEARLLWLLSLLEKNEYLGCSSCKNVICHRKDVFLMSSSGPQNSFVNSAGYVHDTLTVNKAKGLVYQYQWSTEFTWFPGYAWRIACCDHCSHHIGWCYKSTSPNTKPKKFWGLSRSSVRLQSDQMVDYIDGDLWW